VERRDAVVDARVAPEHGRVGRGPLRVGPERAPVFEGRLRRRHVELGRQDRREEEHGGRRLAPALRELRQGHEEGLGDAAHGRVDGRAALARVLDRRPVVVLRVVDDDDVRAREHARRQQAHAPAQGRRRHAGVVQAHARAEARPQLRQELRGPGLALFVLVRLGEVAAARHGTAEHRDLHPLRAPPLRQHPAPAPPGDAEAGLVDGAEAHDRRVAARGRGRARRGRRRGRRRRRGVRPVRAVEGLEDVGEPVLDARRFRGERGALRLELGEPLLELGALRLEAQGGACLRARSVLQSLLGRRPAQPFSLSLPLLPALQLFRRDLSRVGDRDEREREKAGAAHHRDSSTVECTDPDDFTFLRDESNLKPRRAGAASGAAPGPPRTSP